MTENRSLPSNEDIQHNEATDAVQSQSDNKQTAPEQKPKKEKPAPITDNNRQQSAIKSDAPKSRSKDTTNKTPVSKLSILAILLTFGLGTGIYFHGHRQVAEQQATIASLQRELTTLHESLSQQIQQELTQASTSQNQQLAQLQQKVNDDLIKQQQSQNQFTTKIDDAMQINEQSLQKLHAQLSALSPANNNNWLISQADYLVNLAGRKIWNDQDYVTARLLLKSADASLAETNDPSLLPVRQAIAKDMSSLALISHIDFDGIVMSLMEMANQVSDLPLVDNYEAIDLSLVNYDDSFSEAATEHEATSSEMLPAETPPSTFSRWYHNLLRNGQSFLNKFVTVEKYDQLTNCLAKAGQNKEAAQHCQIYRALITPEQSVYLRENLRLQLFIAAQAVPRHQDAIYQQALKDVSSSIYAYFNTQAPMTQAFIDELTQLQEQTISQKYLPEKLASAPLLAHLMQTRVRDLLTAN
ncbi:uroporphyrinogen-III C-methyltransferase [Utexia brackfieldae]|uniref:uroporphyrinogen-III C-methyltransferase n=1 Tax=Utexia brackfieldae TaxID=3074108 RepID=UPI00370D530C